MPKEDEARLRLAPLGEWYEDLLLVDAAINGRSPGTQGLTLLCAKLQEREPKIKERVQYLADKRKISYQEMWTQLRTDTARKLSNEEILAIQTQNPEEEN